MKAQGQGPGFTGGPRPQARIWLECLCCTLDPADPCLCPVALARRQSYGVSGAEGRRFERGWHQRLVAAVGLLPASPTREDGPQMGRGREWEGKAQVLIQP